MQDRFKFRAIVKGYYYIDTPEKCEEIEPLIFLENVDVLDIGDIGLSEEDLEITIRKQYSELSDIYIERILENFRDNSNGIDTYITITPERVYQCTGLKDKNGKLIYEGDILQSEEYPFKSEEGYNYAAEVLWDYASAIFYYYTFRISNNVVGRSTGNTGELNEYEDWKVIGNIYQNPELLED